MELKSLQNQFDLKELELNALLEITQAINNNLPEVSLYKIYGFIVRANLHIKKLALYVKDEEWLCKVNYGTNADFWPQPLDEAFLTTRKIKYISEGAVPDPFDEFDLVIPVLHKDEILAFIFMGGMVEQSNGNQPNLDTSFIQTISNILLVAIENKRLARKQLEQEAMRKEMEIARGVQQLLFPKGLPHSQNLKVASLYLPHQDVGGDYYDYIKIDEQEFVLCIADVSGKGVPAALLMSNFQAALRTMVRHTTDLRRIVTELNYQTERNARGENFITFFIAIVNIRARKLEYVNAGHNPPLIILDHGGPQYLELGTTILGSFEPLPFLKVGKVRFDQEFMFFAYTDGLSETFDVQGEPFGTERVTASVVKHQDLPLDQINGELLVELNQFRGSKAYTDDITLLSCKVLAESE
jgi:sigma-B regulation protein RsbU (phosphoserine phosphatase)